MQARSLQEVPLATSSRIRFVAATSLAVIVATGCGGGAEQDVARSPRVLPPTPAEHREGERLYAASCAGCHGIAGVGSDSGPPLVHKVYEPSHHADVAFQLAVQRGVVAHHWRFGNMPPQPQVTTEQVAPIVGYVRWLQRQSGIE